MSEKKKERRPRRKFTREFKNDVVKLCRSGNESVGDVAKRLDPTETAVRAWVKQADIDEGRGRPDALTTDEKAELARLRDRKMLPHPRTKAPNEDEAQPSRKPPPHLRARP
jgi:transposase